MVSSAFNISLSGLNAASRRLQVSANNVANQSSTKTVQDGVTLDKPYQAQRVSQQSQATGGVSTVVEDKQPPTIKIFNPTADNTDANGASEVPNVSDEDEIISQIIASYDFKANLNVIRKQDEIEKSLLNIIS